MIRVMDLFSGIGGFSLGLKRAGGFKTVCYCEIEPYCQRVLQARMRDGSLDTAPICTDIRKLDGEPLRGRVEMVCGGFPCQDISVAGKGAGIGGERSGLWKEMARLIREIRPRYVFVENVSALLVRGMGTVLGDLAEIGYDAEWEVVSAAVVGAPHIRERIWIVAYPQSEQDRRVLLRGLQSDPGAGGEMAYADCQRRQVIQGGEAVAELSGHRAACRGGWWDAEPPVGRVADGVPSRVDRLTALGNAVVPQVVEWIGRRIVKASTREGHEQEG